MSNNSTPVETFPFLQSHYQEQYSLMVLHCVTSLISFVTLGIIASSDSSVSIESIASTKSNNMTDRTMESIRHDINEEDEAVAGMATVRHILHFSDVHLNISKTLNDSDSATIPISYGDDAPISLLVSALDYAKKLLPDPDLFLYTGDHVVHGELSDEYVAEAVAKNVETMAKYYSTLNNDTMLDITAIIGNADTNPDYTMKVTDPLVENNPAIALISKAWKKTMSKSEIDWFNHRGYSAYALDDNLTVITLNTLPYSPSHLPDTSKLPDPFEQFTWLNASLSELKSTGKLAYIVGHIPPIIDSYSGSPMWNENYIEAYKQIVSQHTDVIKAQFFGHVHSVEFRLPLSSSQSAQFQQDGVTVKNDDGDSSKLVPLFMTAALSPIFSSNPAFMVWDFDGTSYEITGFTVYGGNISASPKAVDWKALFKASQEYGVSSLNASEMTRFVERAAADAKLLEQYYFNSKAQSRLQSSCLDVSCQAEWLCSLYWWSTAADYAACVMSTKASKSAAIQQILSSSAGSQLYGSAFIIFGGMATAAVFVLLFARVCRREGDQGALKLLPAQRLHQYDESLSTMFM